MTIKKLALASIFFMSLLIISCDKDPSCTDGEQNGTETGIDCGGDCTPCATCSDGIQNGSETGIDCGGDCDPCTATPTCDDGIQNGNETGIDCGGDCDACPTCDDGIQNGNETGIDCGGDCDACPTCDDGIQNGNETGIDCGGDCDPCAIGCAETTYDNTIKALIEKSCSTTGCHDGTNGNAPQYTDYAKVLAGAGKIENRALVQKNMPPSWGSIPELTADEMEKLQCWIDNGMKEN